MQKRLILLNCSLVLAALASAVSAQEEGFESIFNGKDLTGWEGRQDIWSVEDGAITGRTSADKPLQANTFLIWRAGKLENFELRLKFKIVGGNSGIQYRSEDKGDFVVGGYQADIDATLRFMGILYEERGRGILANRGTKVVIEANGEKKEEGKTCDEQELLDSIQKEGWNEYVIIAQGNHLIQKINGFTTVDVTDHQADKAAKEGILALQVHVGPPMVVQFKDIQLRRIDD